MDRKHFEEKTRRYIKEAIKRLIPFQLSEDAYKTAYDFMFEYVSEVNERFGLNLEKKYDFELISYLIHLAILDLLFFDTFFDRYHFRKFLFFELHRPNIEKWRYEDLDNIGRFYREGLRKSIFSESATSQISIETELQLTPEVLANLITPYIEAISNIQKVFNNLEERARLATVAIRFITQQSPVSIGLDGAGDAINALKEDVIPWRKENAKKIAEIQTRNLEADIKRKEAETLEIRARSQKDKARCEKIKAEAAKMRAEAEQITLENEKSKFELNKARLDLAFELIAKMYPNLDESQRVVHVLKLLPALHTLTTIELDVSIVE